MKLLKCFVVVVSLIVHHTLGQGILLPSTDQYLFGIQKLVPSFNKINAFDGPTNISNAPITTPLKITKPTTEQMRYYNFYTGSVNCGFGVKTMVCGYCAMIRGDIKKFIGKISIYDNKSGGIIVSKLQFQFHLSV